MARRRMLDPSFTDDFEVSQLTRDERLFLVGCVRNADDEGRLRGHPAFLKAGIFMYDDDIDLGKMEDIKTSTLVKMEKWSQDNIWRLVLYGNSGNDFLYFPLWYSWQAPSHPQPSQLPAPPDVPSTLEVPFTEKDRKSIYERDNWICQYCGADLVEDPRKQSIDHVIPLTRGGSHTHENLVTACKSCNLKKRNRLPEEAGMKLLPTCQVKPTVNQEVNQEVNHDVIQPLSQDRSGQVRSDKVSIGKDNLIAVLDSEDDLTDLLTTTLTEYMQRGPVACMPVVDKLWEAAGRKMKTAVFDVWFQAMKEYPASVVAVALAKSVKYAGGAQDEAKYTIKILQEQMGKRKRAPPH